MFIHKPHINNDITMLSLKLMITKFNWFCSQQVSITNVIASRQLLIMNLPISGSQHVDKANSQCFSMFSTKQDSLT